MAKARRRAGTGRASAGPSGCTASAGRGRGTGELRIVGGRHRGRKLPVLLQEGLRPTSDRTRETLFNWLAPVIEGSRCLDCFAGSGALALEALSRGAERVVMIERAPAVARQLRDNLSLLRVPAEAAEVVEDDALRWLAEAPMQAFDIVFVDPPFDADLLSPACTALQRRGWVGEGGLVYLEAPVRAAMTPLPAAWVAVRDKRAGQVRYALIEVGRDDETDSDSETA